MFVDYYDILDIGIDSTPVEVKSAFKKQALKWHPDKNNGVDTTEMMQNINEAYLILKDSEARNLYNKEYVRFKEFKKAHSFSNNSQKEEKSHNKEQEQKNNKHKSNTESQAEDFYYSTYQMFDETLNKWMQNARSQAVTLAQKTIEDLRGMSIDGGKAIGNAALIGIGRYIGFSIIMLIIFKACNN